MSANKSLSKGGVYYLIYNVLNVAFPFFTGIYVARKVLPEYIGEVTAAQNLAQYFVIFAFLGIPTYGLREIAKNRSNKEEVNKIFSELFLINLFSTIVFVTLYFGLILIVPKYRCQFLLHAIVGISIALNAFNISWLYDGLEEFRFISIRNLVFKVISFVCLVLLVRKPDDFLSYAAINVIGTAGNYIVNMLYSPKFARLSFKDLNLRRHLKSIFILVTVNLAIEIYTLMDVTMMDYMCTKESIAYYKYGHNIQRILLQVVNTFTMVLVPRISYYYKEKQFENFNALVSKGMKLIIITAIPMIVGIYFTSDFLIQKLYGVQFANSATLLKLFSLLLMISPTGYLLGSRILLVTNHEKRMIICVGAGAIVNLVGNLVLIPWMQEYGAAMASVISEIVVMSVYVMFGKKHFKLINVGRTLIKVLISVALMALYLFLCSRLPLNGWLVLLFEVLGSIGIYVGMLMLTKEEIISQYWKMIFKKKKKTNLFN